MTVTAIKVQRYYHREITSRTKVEEQKGGTLVLGKALGRRNRQLTAGLRVERGKPRVSGSTSE